MGENFKEKNRFLSLSLSFCSVAIFFVLLLSLDKPNVFFVRWFWAPFFEQVVYAVGLFVVTSVRDVSPVAKKHFHLSTK